jgi:hypothetical protein
MAEHVAQCSNPKPWSPLLFFCVRVLTHAQHCKRTQFSDNHVTNHTVLNVTSFNMQQLNVLLRRESFIYEMSYDTVTWRGGHMSFTGLPN